MAMSASGGGGAGGGGFGGGWPTERDFDRAGGPFPNTHQGHRLWASMSDGFWVYVFKVIKCERAGNHDWRMCPYAHPGERAGRRDPRLHAYMAVACPYYRASQQYHLARGTGEAPTCVVGADCRCAHGVFELWLHPRRFRTRMCDRGVGCPRKICFFAHHPAERRRQDDVVPLIGLPEFATPLPPPLPLPLPSLLLPPPPPPPPVMLPRRYQFVDPPFNPFLGRTGTMMQTRSGALLPLYTYAAPPAPPLPPIGTPIQKQKPQLMLLKDGPTSSSSAGSSNNNPPNDDDDDDDDSEYDSIVSVLNNLSLLD